MKIVIATDSYKGTFSASEASEKLARAIARLDSDIEVMVLPIADGGEGTLRSFATGTGMELESTEVTTPDHKRTIAEYGILSAKEAVIESAQAIGLNRITQEKNPLTATSYGLGELIKGVLEHSGIKKIYISLGDSGINDGGIGMAVALGWKCYDKEGYEYIPSGGTLARLGSIDDSEIDKRIAGIEFIGLADVNNELLGELGATRVFAKQKGAREEEFEILEEGLRRLAEVLESAGYAKHTKTASSGACGGVGYGILTFLKGRIQSGIETVIAQVGLKEKSHGAGIIVTGEGKLDKQTLGGKAISGVAKVAKAVKAKLVAVVGINELSEAEYTRLGIDCVYELKNNDFNEVAERIIAFAKRAK